MNGLLKSAIIVLIVSVAAYLWGSWYVNAHPFGGVASMFGASDSTYSIAHSSVLLGVLGFLLGLGLLIAALVRTNTRKTDTTTSSANVPGISTAGARQQQISAGKFCSGCGGAVGDVESAFCLKCGVKL